MFLKDCKLIQDWNVLRRMEIHKRWKFLKDWNILRSLEEIGRS